MKKNILTVICACTALFTKSQITQWVHPVSAPDTQEGFALMLHDGYVYAGGVFFDTVDFDPGPAVFNLISAGSRDAYITRFDTNGNFDWAVSWGNSMIDNLYALTVDTDGNVIVTGSFNGTVDFDPGPSVFTLSATGSGSDTYVIKLNSSGNLVWAKSFNGPFDNGLGVAIIADSQRNIYVSGNFQGTCDYDPGAGVANLVSTGSNDVFVAKLDSAGNYMWAKNFGSPSIDQSLCIAIDNASNIYITGLFMATGDFDPGPSTFNLTSAGSSDIFVSKLSSAGNFIWAKRVGGTGIDNGMSVYADTVRNEILLTGTFQNTIDADPNAGTVMLTAAGLNDIVILNLDMAGNYSWSKQFGGTQYVTSDWITRDVPGNIYVSGYFEGAVDFNPGAGIYSVTSNGNFDMFINKLDSTGNFIQAYTAGSTGYDRCKTVVADEFHSVYFTGSFSDTVDFQYGQGIFERIANGTDSYIGKLRYCQLAASAAQVGITLTAQQNNMAYQWIDCGNAGAVISGETSQSFTPAVDGSYAVIVNDNGCVDTSVCYAVTGVGTSEMTKKRIRVQPTLANNEIMIYQDGSVEKLNIELFDLTGKPVIKKSSFNAVTALDVTFLPQGIYLVKVHQQMIRVSIVH